MRKLYISVLVVLGLAMPAGAVVYVLQAVAPSADTYLIKTTDTVLGHAQAMGSLGSGLRLSTATTGVQSTYAGTSVSNQCIRSIDASGSATGSGVGVNDFTANQGKTTQALFGNASGQPSWQPASTFLYTNALSTSGSAITVFTLFTSTPGSVYGFHCSLTGYGTATASIHYLINTTDTPTLIAYKYLVFLTNSTSASTGTFSAKASVTPDCGSGCASATTTAYLDGIVQAAGTASYVLQYGSAGNGQTVHLNKGSWCEVYTP